METSELLPPSMLLNVALYDPPNCLEFASKRVISLLVRSYWLCSSSSASLSVTSTSSSGSFLGRYESRLLWLFPRPILASGGSSCVRFFFVTFYSFARFSLCLGFLDYVGCLALSGLLGRRWWSAEPRHSVMV